MFKYVNHRYFVLSTVCLDTGVDLIVRDEGYLSFQDVFVLSDFILTDDDFTRSLYVKVLQ